MSALVRSLFNRRQSIALVQNPDDRDSLISLGIDEKRISLIPGSGVDIHHFKPCPEPAGEPTIAFVGRLLEDKGIRTLVAAHQLLRRRGLNVNLMIAGTPDPSNPGSVSNQEVEVWRQQPGIQFLGQVQDISGLWAQAHIAVLPSRREGLPKALLEAAACGRPLVATDVPGCREIVIPGTTGLLVPLDDAPALASALETLTKSPDLRARYGAAARKLVEARFSDQIIGQQTVELYRRLVFSQH